jgi:hypothetical protein
LNWRKQGEDLGAAVGVEVAGRLVGQDDLRLVDQGPGDGDALLLAARELGRLVVGSIGQADEAERLERGVLGLPCP